MSIEETSYDAMMDNIADKSTGNAGESNSRSLSIEELLKPRYKAIADYPFSFVKIGVIIKGETLSINDNIVSLSNYPHLFKKLEWWEERTIEQLKSVDFVKVTHYTSYWRVGDIVKVSSFVYDSEKMRYGYNLEYKHYHPFCYVEPATEEEYIQYQQNK